MLQVMLVMLVLLALMVANVNAVDVRSSNLRSEMRDEFDYIGIAKTFMELVDEKKRNRDDSCNTLQKLYLRTYDPYIMLHSLMPFEDTHFGMSTYNEWIQEKVGWNGAWPESCGGSSQKLWNLVCPASQEDKNLQPTDQSVFLTKVAASSESSNFMRVTLGCHSFSIEKIGDQCRILNGYMFDGEDGGYALSDHIRRHKGPENGSGATVKSCTDLATDLKLIMLTHGANTDDQNNPKDGTCVNGRTRGSFTEREDAKKAIDFYFGVDAVMFPTSRRYNDRCQWREDHPGQQIPEDCGGPKTLGYPFSILVATCKTVLPTETKTRLETDLNEYKSQWDWLQNTKGVNVKTCYLHLGAFQEIKEQHSDDGQRGTYSEESIHKVLDGLHLEDSEDTSSEAVSEIATAAVKILEGGGVQAVVSVDPCVVGLTDMGYDKELSTIACGKTHGNIQHAVDAVDILTRIASSTDDETEEVSSTDHETKEVSSIHRAHHSSSSHHDCIEKLVRLGIAQSQAHHECNRASNDANAAANAAYASTDYM